MTINTSIQANFERPLSEYKSTLSLDAPAEPPPLESGDRLSRAEFERRYIAHPEIKKAELVEGVVYVSSPIRVKQHGYPHALIVTWLGVYAAATPGTMVAGNATVRLDNENEPQPDAFLRLEPEHGGTSRVSEDDYLEGPPDLVVEVAASSASYDLNDKLRAYQRNGVREYLVLQMYERRADWFVLRDGVFEPLMPDESGILRSTIFPGLWLKSESIWTGDLAAMLSTLQEGLASPEHVEFAARLRDHEAPAG
ncbi:MAG TPA: Uma2 family endonuclease [Armatimonadota bacterium]|nr:Uma2 family endonuclease [Armatimonadota bacterium]